MAKARKAAFYWIVQLLRKHKISYRITGGFAARLYSSKRPLADIDIDLPMIGFRKILPEARPYASNPPFY